MPEDKFTPEDAVEWEEPKLKISESLLGDKEDHEQPVSELRMSPSLRETIKGGAEGSSEDIVNQLIATEGDPEALESFLEGHSYIQRDSGRQWNLVGFSETIRGRSVQLQDTESSGRVSLNLSDFVQKLKTPESPWGFA